MPSTAALEEPLHQDQRRFSRRPVVARINSTKANLQQRHKTLSATILNVFLQPRQHSQWLITAEHGLFALLLSLVFVVRVTNLRFNTLHLDEAIYTNLGQAALAGDFDQEATRWLSGSYLYPIVANLAARIGGVVGLRALSAVLLTLAALFVYLTVRRIFDYRSALFALFVFGFTGISIDLGQYAVNDAMGVAFLAAALYCSTCAVVYLAEANTYLVWAGLAFSLSVLAQYAVILALPGLMFVMLILYLYRGRSFLSFLTEVPWGSFIVPVGTILGFYVAFYRNDLGEALTRALVTQPQNRGTLTLQILRDIGVPLLFALIAIPIIAQKAANHVRNRQLMTSIQFVLCLPGLIVAINLILIYHVVTANARALWTHEIYVLVFLAPLAGFGVAASIEYLRSLQGEKAIRVRLLGAALTLIASFWFVINAWHQNADFHTSWPNNQRVIDYIQRLPPTSQVLSPSRAIYDFYTVVGKSGYQVGRNRLQPGTINAEDQRTISRAIQDCAYGLVVLDDYYAPELSNTLETLVRQAGYKIVFAASETLSTNVTVNTHVYIPIDNNCKGTWL